MEDIKESNRDVFELPESFTISECQEQYSQLIEKLSNEEELHLDASKVKHVDTAGLQLLASLMNKNENKKIIWHQSSSELENNAINLGLKKHLNIN